MIDSSQLFNLGTNSEREYQLKAAINTISNKHVLKESEIKELIKIVLDKAGKSEVEEAISEKHRELSDPLRDLITPVFTSAPSDIDGMIQTFLLNALQICHNLIELTEGFSFMPFEHLKEILTEC